MAIPSTLRRFRLPAALPPSFRGSAIRFVYLIEVKAVYEVHRGRLQLPRLSVGIFVSLPQFALPGMHLALLEALPTQGWLPAPKIRVYCGVAGGLEALVYETVASTSFMVWPSPGNTSAAAERRSLENTGGGAAYAGASSGQMPPTPREYGRGSNPGSGAFFSGSSPALSGGPLGGDSRRRISSAGAGPGVVPHSPPAGSGTATGASPQLPGTGSGAGAPGGQAGGAGGPPGAGTGGAHGGCDDQDVGMCDYILGRNNCRWVVFHQRVSSIAS